MNYYVQFYRIDNNMLYLNNGFSSVWNVIKNKGEILWINVDSKFYPNIDKGTVYISSWLEKDTDYIKQWVFSRPDINFVVGGPTVNYMNFNIDTPNFVAESRYMFDVLGVRPDLQMWNLEYPVQIDKDYNIYYNFSLSYGNRCYWGKCSFCNRKSSSYSLDLNVDCVPIIKPWKTRIWLNKLSIEPRDILNLFPKLNKRAFYSFFLRADHLILDALDKIEIRPNLVPMIGVEFASDRMLKRMNKGITIETIVSVVKKFVQNNCFPKLFFIHGWPDLIESDIDEVKKFLQQIELYKSRISFVNHWLFCHEKQENTIEVIKPFNKSYYLYVLDKKQKELNRRVLELYKNFGFCSYSEAGIFKEKFLED